MCRSRPLWPTSSKGLLPKWDHRRRPRAELTTGPPPTRSGRRAGLGWRRDSRSSSVPSVDRHAPAPTSRPEAFVVLEAVDCAGGNTASFEACHRWEASQPPAPTRQAGDHWFEPSTAHSALLLASTGGNPVSPVSPLVVFTRFPRMTKRARTGAAVSRARHVGRETPSTRRSLSFLTRCWPCKSNSVRLGSSGLARKTRWRPSGFRPGFWPAGPVQPLYSSQPPPARSRLSK